jgi:hypothetical protein
MPTSFDRVAVDGLGRQLPRGEEVDPELLRQRLEDVLGPAEAALDQHLAQPLAGALGHREGLLQLLPVEQAVLMSISPAGRGRLRAGARRGACVHGPGGEGRGRLGGGGMASFFRPGSPASSPASGAPPTGQQHRGLLAAAGGDHARVEDVADLDVASLSPGRTV